MHTDGEVLQCILVGIVGIYLQRGTLFGFQCEFRRQSAIITDSTGFKYNGQVYNGPDNPFYAFNAMFDGAIVEHGAEINAKVYDKDERLGLDIGAVAAIEPNGVRINLVDTKPVIGYMPFTANEDNYVFL